MSPTHFEQQLDAVTSRLVEMSRSVEELMEQALGALKERDPARVAAVLMGDREVDIAEVEIEESCVQLLALRQPMARDLRQIVAILKINNDLERVGDHAVNIAEAAQRLIDSDGDWSVPIELLEESTLAREMLRDALDALVQGDAKKARDVTSRDDRVDQLHESLFRSMLTIMMESPRQIGRALELIQISRNVERVADLATNIGEDVVYLVEGVTIRHPDSMSEDGAA